MTGEKISTAAALLAGLRKQGFELRADGGRLLISPASSLTPIQAEAVRGSRDALLEILAQEKLAARRIVLLGEGDWRTAPVAEVVLESVLAEAVHGELARLMRERPGEVFGAEWLSPLLGWRRWLSAGGESS